jgi:hypothetical protein
MQLKHHLEGNYPELRGNIQGGNYPPPQYADIIAKVSGAVQFGTIALALLGDTLFGMAYFFVMHALLYFSPCCLSMLFGIIYFLGCLVIRSLACFVFGCCTESLTLLTRHSFIHSTTQALTPQPWLIRSTRTG